MSLFDRCVTKSTPCYLAITITRTTASAIANILNIIFSSIRAETPRISEQGDYHSVDRCRLENSLIADPNSTWTRQDSPSHNSQRRRLHLQTRHRQSSSQGRALRPGITAGPVAHQLVDIFQASLGEDLTSKITGR